MVDVNNPHEFCKTIGKVGVTNARGNNILMEILEEDSSINNNPNAILEKWAGDFSSLLNQVPGDPTHHQVRTDVDISLSTDNHSETFNGGISWKEVERAVCYLKNSNTCI